MLVFKGIPNSKDFYKVIFLHINPVYILVPYSVKNVLELLLISVPRHSYPLTPLCRFKQWAFPTYQLRIQSEKKTAPSISAGTLKPSPMHYLQDAVIFQQKISIFKNTVLKNFFPYGGKPRSLLWKSGDAPLCYSINKATRLLKELSNIVLITQS